MTQNLGRAVVFSSRLLRNTEGAPPRASMLQAQPRSAGLAHHSKEHLLHTCVPRNLCVGRQNGNHGISQLEFAFSFV